MLFLDNYSKHRTIDFLGRCSLIFFYLFDMIIKLSMIDTKTGEIIATRTKDYALNFACKNDCGFRYLMEWCMSCVRGVRTTEHKSIELRVHFEETIGSLPLPFGMTEADVRDQASQYVR